MIKHWTMEVLEVNAMLNDKDVYIPINVLVHRDRGIAVGNAAGFISNDDPNGLYITDILHVPSRKRMFTIAARLGEAISIAYIIALLTRWQDHEDVDALLRDDKSLQTVIKTLIHKEYVLVIPGSRDEERLHQLAFAVANPSTHPAGNA